MKKLLAKIAVVSLALSLLGAPSYAAAKSIELKPRNAQEQHLAPGRRKICEHNKGKDLGKI